jgi:hypothetical protein
VPESATVSGLPAALPATDREPDAEPAAVGANLTLAVQDAPAASELPQVLVCENGPLTDTETPVAVALPVFVTVTDCAELVEPTFTLPNETLDGDADRALLPPPLFEPPPGKTSNSDSCAALQPVFAVKLSCTYLALVPVGRLIVTVFPLDGLNEYPAEPTIWLNEVSFVLPSTESVSVRVDQAEDGGRSSVTEPIDCVEPRSTVSVCGYAAPSVLSQYVLELPSFASAATYVWVKLLALIGWLSARLVVEVTPVPLSATDNALPGALLVTVSAPVSGPPVVGANFTLAVHEPPAAIEPPQVLVSLNGPVTAIEETDAAPVPGFEIVTDCAALVEPEATSPNARLAGEAASAPGSCGSGKVVSTGVVLLPELPLPRLKVNAPGV